MLFTLITTLKENAEAHIFTRIQEVQNEKEAESRREEEEENRKFEGEKVTREGFLKWREGYIREMEEERKKREDEEEKEGRGKKDARKEGKRLTGRELWEGGLVGKIEGDGDEEEEEGGMGVEGLKVGD